MMIYAALALSFVECFGLADGAFGRKEGDVHILYSAQDLYVLDDGLSCEGEDLPTPHNMAPAALPRQCCDFCSRIPNCVAFTHVSVTVNGKPVPTCLFKSGCATLRTCSSELCTAGRLRHGVSTHWHPESLGGCDLCNDLRWVFVVAGGRSGSTTLMHMLNAVPGVHIDGENEGIHIDLQALWRHAKRTVALYDQSAWAQQELRQAPLLCAMQRYVAAAIGGVQGRTVVGYKEIRWNVSAHQLDFMLELFPCARFIFNDRSKMTMWQKSVRDTEGFTVEQADALPRWQQQVRKWIKSHAAVPTFHFPLEHYHDLGRWNSLLRFLGVHACRFNRVAHFNKRGYEPDDNKLPLLHCEYL